MSRDGRRLEKQYIATAAARLVGKIIYYNDIFKFIDNIYTKYYGVNVKIIGKPQRPATPWNLETILVTAITAENRRG